MRTLTDAQYLALTNDVGAKHCLRVKVADSDGTMRDLRTLWGLDWCLGAEWSVNLEDETAIATVRLTRRHHEGSLAPLMEASTFNNLTGSYAALLSPGRLVTIEVASIGLDDGPERPTVPLSSDWAEVFRGRLDEVETAAGDSDLSLRCRDLAGIIFDRFIETEVEYGSEAGTALESVIQSLLNNNGLSSITLYTPVSPAWNLSTFTQRRAPLGQAIADLVSQIGWECRYKWDNATSAWRYTLYEPPRSKTTADWTLTADQYRAVQSFAQSMDDVRTRWSVAYADINDLDATGKPKRKTATATNTALEEELGSASLPYVKWAHISTTVNKASLNVDTTAEAQRLADTALEDTGYVPTTATIGLDLAWHFDVGDLIELTANDITHDTDIALAVTDVRHLLNEDKATTTVTLRGNPGMSHLKWARFDWREGMYPAPFTAPLAPQNLTSTPTVNGVALSFQRNAYGPPPAQFELHVSTSSGFTPDLGEESATFVKASDSTRFDVNTLAPGATYYAKVVPRDMFGTHGTASAQATVAPRYVEPRLLVPRVSYGTLPRNGDLEAHSDAAQPPDGFTMPTGTWGTGAAVTSDSFSGTRAIIMQAGLAEIDAEPFTCREGEALVVSAAYKSSTVSGTIGTLRVDFVNESLTLISSTSIALSGVSSYVTIKQLIRVPASTRYCRLAVVRTALETGTLTFDGLEVLRTPAFSQWSAFDPAGEAGTYNVFLNDWADNGGAAYRMDDLGNVQLRGSIIAPTPAPPASGAVVRLSRAPTVEWGRRIVTSTGAVALVTIDTDGYLRVSSITAGATLHVDGIEYTNAT